MPKEPVRDFSEFIEELNDGRFNAFASGKFHDLINQVADRASATERQVKGEFKIVFKVAIDPFGNATIEPSVETKTQKDDVPGGVMFMTEGGNLSTQKPGQPELPFHDVSRPAEVRDIDSARK